MDGPVTVEDTERGGGEVDPGNAPDASPEESLVWALVLAGASEPSDALLMQAAADAEALGYSADPTNCDRGAAAALGMSPDETYTVSVHFGTEADARQAESTFEASGLLATLAAIELICPA